MADPRLVSRWVLKTLRPRQNGRHFSDDIFKCIFINEKFCISILISLKFVPRGPIASSGSGNGLAPNRRQAITWTNADPVHWRIYAALEGDGVMAVIRYVCIIRAMLNTQWLLMDWPSLKPSHTQQWWWRSGLVHSSYRHLHQRSLKAEWQSWGWGGVTDVPKYHNAGIWSTD